MRLKRVLQVTAVVGSTALTGAVFGDSLHVAEAQSGPAALGELRVELPDDLVWQEVFGPWPSPRVWIRPKKKPICVQMFSPRDAEGKSLRQTLDQLCGAPISERDVVIGERKAVRRTAKYRLDKSVIVDCLAVELPNERHQFALQYGKRCGGNLLDAVKVVTSK